MTITPAVRTGATNNDTLDSLTCVATMSANGAGNLVVVGVGWVDQVGTRTCTVADNKGNTFTAIGSKVRNASLQYSVQMFHCSGVVASAGTVTYTATLSSSANFTDIKIEELSSSLGAWTSSALDTVMTGGTGDSTAMATSAATPTVDNCAIITYGGANSGTITAGSGFTLRTTGANGLGLADLVQTTKASKAGLLTTSVSSLWTICAAAFKEPSSSFNAKNASQFFEFF
jgi:hypothetical protein